MCGFEVQEYLTTMRMMKALALLLLLTCQFVKTVEWRVMAFSLEGVLHLYV
jgi:hypothetical protein